MLLTLIFALLTAAIHYYIFYLELIAYGNERFNRVFQIPEAELAIVKAPFNNLAVYNLAVAIFATLGILLNLFQHGLNGAGKGMIFAALGTASIAGIYLAISQPSKRRAAAIQSVPALLGIFFLIF